MDVTFKYGCFPHVALYLVSAKEQVVSGKPIFYFIHFYKLFFFVSFCLFLKDTLF